uniref:TAZ-type domain-containing protein n=1 Tax=Anisakis simplex TaxID=6269 RepID=A0A0M3J4X8_ANISI
LNQIRKTRSRDVKSNGGNTDGVRKRFLLSPVSHLNSTEIKSNNEKPTTPVISSDHMSNSPSNPLLETPAYEDNLKKMPSERRYSAIRRFMSRFYSCLCPPDRDWTITSVQVSSNEQQQHIKTKSIE